LELVERMTPATVESLYLAWLNDTEVARRTEPGSSDATSPHYKYYRYATQHPDRLVYCEACGGEFIVTAYWLEKLEALAPGDERTGTVTLDGIERSDAIANEDGLEDHDRLDLISEYRQFLNRFPKHPAARKVRARIEELERLAAEDPGMQAPIDVSTPATIRQLISGTVLSAKRIDFDGDTKPDLLVLVEGTKPPGEEHAVDTEIWVTADFKIVRRAQRFRSGGYDYRWFVNLDDEPTPELITASGYEDGIDYSIERLDPVTFRQSVVLRFHPVIVQLRGRERTLFWGYPWDLRHALVRRRGGRVELLSMLDHTLTRESESVPASLPWQRRMPVVFFTGAPTQPGELDVVGAAEWLTLAELLRRAALEKP
jgi:hypothetical protein